MIKTTDSVIEEFGLKPHPFEGWSIETARTIDYERTFLWLITAEMFIPWNRMPAQMEWRLIEGSPCAVSMSIDGHTASTSVIGRGHLPALTVARDAFQTLTSVGRWSLLEGRLRPDIALTDRCDQPDDWYPKPEIGTKP